MGVQLQSPRQFGKPHRLFCAAFAAALTQAVDAEAAVIKEVTDVSGLGGHRTERVGTAGHEGVNAAGAHVGKKGPSVHVVAEIQRI